VLGKRCERLVKDALEFCGVFRSEKDVPHKTGLLIQNEVLAEVGGVQLDGQRAFAKMEPEGLEDGRVNFDLIDLVERDLKDPEPGVKFDAVVVDFVFLPETFFRAIGDVDWCGAHDVA